MVKDPGLRIPEETLPGIAGRDPARAGRAEQPMIGLDPAQVLLEPAPEPLVEHRAVHDVTERVADCRTPGRLVKLAGKFLPHVLVHDGRAQ